MVEVTVAFIWHISLVVKIEEAPRGGTWRQSIWRGSGPCPIRMLLPLLWGGYHRVVCNSRTTHFSKEVLEKLIELFMTWHVAPWYLQNRRRGRAMVKVWCKLPSGEQSWGRGQPEGLVNIWGDLQFSHTPGWKWEKITLCFGASQLSTFFCPPHVCNLASHCGFCTCMWPQSGCTALLAHDIFPCSIKVDAFIPAFYPRFLGGKKSVSVWWKRRSLTAG